MEKSNFDPCGTLERLSYLIGKIEGLIDAGCSYDGSEFIYVIRPIKDELCEIYNEIRENTDRGTDLWV